MSLPTPNTRKEQYLNAIATGNAGGLPTPITREEEYLDAIAKSGGGSGDGDMKKSVYDSGLDVAGAGGIKAFVNSAVAGKVDKIEGKGLSTNDYTNEDKAIVDGVTSALADKVDKVEGKGLSTNDYTDGDKAIVDGVTGALATKQDVLTFDDEPTANSNNPVKSGGIFDVVNAITGSLSDNAPYILRKALGNLVYEKIVGCSFVKNQIVDDTLAIGENTTFSNGVYRYTFTPTYGGTYNVINTASVKAPENHKCLVLYKPVSISGADATFMVYTRSSNIPESDRFLSSTSFQKIFIGDVVGRMFLQIRCIKDETYDTSFYYNVFDLTQMFGTEIADYAYSLEQAEEGSGIAWLKSYGFFAEDYIDYDAGSIESVNVSGKKVVGFNLFDYKKAEVGFVYSSDGSVATATGLMHSDFIQIQGGKRYYFKVTEMGSSGRGLAWYDKSYNFISGRAFTTNNIVGVLIAPDNAKFVRFTLLTTELTDVCINLSDPARNGDYEPYKEVVYPLSNRNLLGVPKLVSGHITYDGDIYDADGGVSEKYGIVDLGSLTYGKVGSNDGFFRADLPQNIKPNADMLCENYIKAYATDYTGWLNRDKCFGWLSTYEYLIFKDSSYTDAATFKAAVSGVYLVYEKTVPTTASAIPFQNPQRAFIDGTEEFIDAEVPVGHESTYYLNEIAPEIEDYVDAKVKMAMSEITCQETTEGDYTLKATVDENGKVTYEWVAVTP